MLSLYTLIQLAEAQDRIARAGATPDNPGRVEKIEPEVERIVPASVLLSHDRLTKDALAAIDGNPQTYPDGKVFQPNALVTLLKYTLGRVHDNSSTQRQTHYDDAIKQSIRILAGQDVIPGTSERLSPDQAAFYAMADGTYQRINQPRSSMANRLKQMHPGPARDLYADPEEARKPQLNRLDPRWKTEVGPMQVGANPPQQPSEAEPMGSPRGGQATLTDLADDFHSAIKEFNDALNDFRYTGADREGIDIAWKKLSAAFAALQVRSSELSAESQEFIQNKFEDAEYEYRELE